MSDTLQRVRPDFPPVVYAPTSGVPGSDGGVALEYVVANDGRLALFVYSAIDRLQEFYSSTAPWALLDVADLQHAYDQQPYDLLFLDRRPRLGNDPSDDDSTESAWGSRA